MRGHEPGPCDEHCGREAVGSYALDYEGTRGRACGPCWDQIVAFGKEIGGVTPPPFARFDQPRETFKIRLDNGEEVHLSGPEVVAAHNAGVLELVTSAHGRQRLAVMWDEEAREIKVRDPQSGALLTVTFT